MTRVSGRERYLAARVLNALIREDYGTIATRLTRDVNGVALRLASGRRVRLTSGSPFQDFAVPVPPLTTDGRNHRGGPSLAEVLRTLGSVADPADAAGVAALARECRETLAALELHHRHRRRVRSRLRSAASGRGLIFYETLAAEVDHPIYPTARCRLGLSPDDLVGHAPEFAPEFRLAWAAVPRDRVTATVDPGGLPWWPAPEDVGLPGAMSRTHVLFPVHPLTAPALAVDGPGPIVVAPEPYLTVRPTLSTRTVEVDDRTHLKLPLPTSTLGLRNRRSIRPGTLRDGALAESLLREVLAREPRMRVSLADEQAYGHAGHEHLGWLVRGLPEGEIVPVAALLAELPGPAGHHPRLVLHDLAVRFHGGDATALLRDYLTTLFDWNVTLFVRYGIALEAHQQNLSLLLRGGPMTLLVKDNDGLLASPGLLRAAGLDVPDFGDDRMLTDDPHALADVFVTITLHLAAMAVVHGALADVAAAGGLVREALSAALDRFGDAPMAALLRARTIDAARLVGKSMLVAGTLVAKERTGARDVNKFYGTTGPNYLRPRPNPAGVGLGVGVPPSREADGRTPERLT
ncbi:IucA/IucC family protein [Sphaerimonospora sp. CA-214678]|uniref:IucA/IucC family protein n=1 Tax=Sphaerimonospora sp. CA-214678 TaxID=3240029 RepID=UPI003D8D41E7